MKRFLSFVLAIVLVIGSIAITCKATQINEYSNSSYDVDGYYETVYTLYNGFMTGPCWDGYLADKKNFVYPQVKDELADNGFFQACLSSAEFLTNADWANLFNGEYDADDVKVQYYVTALCSLLMTMEDNWEGIRASQSKADATMTWNEYVAEGASVIAGCLAEENIPETLKTALTACGISISVIGDSIETVDDFATLEACASTFLMYRSLLETLISNTSDTLLAQAAEYLLKAADLCYAYRMNHFDTAINSESDYFFFVLDEVIKEETEDGSLLSGEWTAMGLLNGAAKLGGSFKLGVDSGKFLMDLFIHSSDTILRYYEMCAMASVRDALIIEITKQDSAISGQQDWEKISTVRDLLMDLLYVNVRGEYCAYNLLSNDAGLLSAVHSIFNGKEDAEWFDAVLNIAGNLQRTIEGFFPDWEDYKYDAINQSKNTDIKIIDILLSHEEMWAGQIYKAEPDEWTFFDFSQFAYFHDFDFDGIPEFVIQSYMFSSAHFTNRIIYQVQGNSLQPIQADGWDGFEVRKNIETGTYFHIGHDYAYINAGEQYVGWTENRYAKVSLMDGSLVFEQIYAVYQDTFNSENVDYYGSIFNTPISKDEYDHILQELEETTISFGFETGNLIETWDSSASYENKKEILLDAYHSAF